VSRVSAPVRVEDLSKRFGERLAVDRVSFSAEAGEVFGLLGPNGAGKSTTVRMLCGLLLPTSGTAWIGGIDVAERPAAARRRLGAVLGGERSLYWKLTGRENLHYFAALYGVRDARRRAADLLERFRLADRADELVERYSTGMKQRLALARSMLAEPAVLLLDEPTAGLDPVSARLLRDEIRTLSAEGRTVLLTTHYMEEADDLCNRVAFIAGGRIVALDAPEVLKRELGGGAICRLELGGWRPELQLPGEAVATGDGRWELRVPVQDAAAELPALVASAARAGAAVLRCEAVEPTLEDVFVAVAGQGLRG
jgi:ABC-2 type transport system ATP-binding protein